MYGSKAIVFPPEELEEVAREKKDVSIPASRLDGWFLRIIVEYKTKNTFIVWTKFQYETKYYQIQFCLFLVQGHILEHVRHLVSGCYFSITTWKSSSSTCTVLPVTFIGWHSLNYQRVRLPNANFPNALKFLKICLNFCTIYNFCEMIQRKPVNQLNILF